MPQVLAKQVTATPNTRMEPDRQQVKTSIHYIYFLNLYEGHKRLEKMKLYSWFLNPENLVLAMKINITHTNTILNLLIWKY